MVCCYVSLSNSIQWHGSGSWKSGTVGVVTPRKSTNAIYKLGLFVTPHSHPTRPALCLCVSSYEDFYSPSWLKNPEYGSPFIYCRNPGPFKSQWSGKPTKTGLVRRRKGPRRPLRCDSRVGVALEEKHQWPILRKSPRKQKLLVDLE